MIKKKPIKIKYQNGITEQVALNEILNELCNDFEFVVSPDNPDFILFGPYGEDFPEKGNYIRIGYFCENMIPDFSLCEYAFGIPTESEVNHPNYKRIQWHGLSPTLLIKNLTENDIDRIIESKTGFCNFLYSHPVHYREEFFKQLSKYRKVDAPGKSMRNMPSIDEVYSGSFWERKRQFLKPYKFTIAFENYCYPGYQTEKLYDSMQTNSLPIYCGDPLISDIFNTQSFIHAREYLQMDRSGKVLLLERISRQTIGDYLPATRNGIVQRFIRKLKTEGRKFKMLMETRKLDYSALVDRIVDVDRDDTLYADYLRQPWFKGNCPPDNASSKLFWKSIFLNHGTT